MRFKDTFVSREQMYSLGIDTATHKKFLSIPVSSGIVDYEEYYELTDAQSETFHVNALAASQFADECRRREHDELLIVKPGTNRGTAI
jgi:hypothetical protein